MISALMLAAALAVPDPDLLDLAIARYRGVESYRVTIRSSHADGEDHLRYFYRRPGFVRMEFVKPHAGAVLVYSPTTQRVRLWPFGAGRFPELNLSPGNPLIRSPRGQHVDRSDIGALFDNVWTLRQSGTMETRGEEMLAGRPARHIDVTGTGNFTVTGVHRYELWLDAESLFPLRVVSRDLQNAVIETVRMEDAEIDVDLPEALFEPGEK